MKALLTFLDVGYITLTAEKLNTTVKHATLMIFHDMDSIDYHVSIPRNLRSIKKLKPIIKPLARSHQADQLIKEAKKSLKKWIVVNYPESTYYITNHPDDIMFVSHPTDIMTVIVPENLYNGQQNF